MKIANHVEMLTVAGNRPGIHPVLLWDDEEQILIDACFPLQFDPLRTAVQNAGRDIAQTTQLILTHQDLDHIGCGRELAAAAPRLRVLAHEAEEPYISGALPPIKLAARMEALEAEGSEQDIANVRQMLEGYRNRTMTIDQKLLNGQRLPWCGGITVIHTPGHTPGHICLYLHSCGLLITGDALNAAEGKLSGPNPVHTKDMPQALASLAPLLDFDIRGIVCYHGGFVGENAKAQLQGLISP